jgi:hypothetical protein
MCRSAGVLRPWQAGREAHKNLGSPSSSWGEATTVVWYPAPEARQGKPGHRPMREPGLCGGTRARQAAPSRQRDHPLHAPGVSYHAEYSEVGKAYSMGTDRTAVRRLPRTLLPDTVGSAPQKPPSLQGRANKAKTDQQHRFRDRYGGLDAARLLRLLRKWLQAGMLETDGHVVPPETGSPHGGSISPVRANVYLHCALEVWCATGVPAHWRGKALLCRSADDWGCAFP